MKMILAAFLALAYLSAPAFAGDKPAAGEKSDKKKEEKKDDKKADKGADKGGGGGW